jgi:hypothetical protein
MPAGKQLAVGIAHVVSIAGSPLPNAAPPRSTIPNKTSPVTAIPKLRRVSRMISPP